MVYIKNNIIATRLIEFEPQEIDRICTKITIAKKHWLVFSVCRPPKSGNLDNFLTVLHLAIDKASGKYKNVVITGDMNINTFEHSSSLDKLNELCDILDLHNLVKVSTCEMKGSSTSIDQRHHFKHTHAFETGLSDFHKIVTTCFKSTHVRLQPIRIQYRSYKNFNENDFLSDLRCLPFEQAYSLPNSELAYQKFKTLCSEVVDKHAPLKHRILRGNQAPFMTRGLSKQIMIRSRLRNKFNQHKTSQNWNAYKSQHNKCLSVRRKSVKKFVFVQVCCCRDE